MTFERRIGQLELTDCVPAFDFQNSEIAPGNPALNPERIIVVETDLEHRLANDSETMALRGGF